VRVYRLLLRLFPASFRREYGDEMSAVFERRRRDAAGTGATVRLWIHAVLDVMTNAARVHGDVLQQDLRYTLRTLGRSPAFTATAILVSALGLGATTAAFSMADHVLLRPLPFVDPDRLVKLWEDQSRLGYSRMELSPPNYLDWKRMSTSFEGIAAYTGASVNLVGLGEPERVDGTLATADLFQVLGRQAALGRALTLADGRSDAPRVVVISDGLWRRRFGSDPDALGRSVTLNDTTYTIVGVMPPDFRFPRRDVQFWTPLIFKEENGDDDRTNHYLNVLARLRPGVALGEARSELQVVASRLRREYPKENGYTDAAVVRLRDEVAQQPRLLLFALVGASASLLLIACANLANLLMSRALARRRELAVRTALGASLDRLVRQMLTESLVLAACGGALGLAVALTALPLLARLVPTVLPIAEMPGLDLRMLAVAGVVTIVTGLAFGLTPALGAGHQRAATAIHEDVRSGVRRRTDRLRSALVVAEVGMSVVLLVSAGLLIQALWRVQRVDPGFLVEGVVTLRTSLPIPQYTSTARRQAFYQRVVSDIEALPGVSGAAYISFLPMVMRGGIWPVTGTTRASTDAVPRTASLRFVTPGFFDTIGVPIRLGRDVSEADAIDSLFVAVVSESFAREHWPGENPLGRRFTMAFSERTVVGVVGDIRVRGLERESEPQVYLPSGQVRDGNIIFYTPQDLVIRSSTPPASLMPAVRAIIARADSQQPISSVRLLADIVRDETAPRAVQVRVLGSFAAIALVLAAVGIHGLLAFTVSARTREIGVRLALGAAPRQILGRVLGQGLVLAGGGVALGTALALAAGRTMQALLAGVHPADGATLAGACALAVTMTLAGSLSPALRAMRTDPLVAMRTE
jgi:putative ABC transport system permease protein